MSLTADRIMRKPRCSIIIAAKNEEESIAKVLCSIPDSLRKKSEVIVMDSSTDSTPVIAKRLGAKVIHEKGRGKGIAMINGVKRSNGDVIVFLDADGTDPPEYLPKVIGKLKNADLVIGSRSMQRSKEDDPMMRRLFKIYAPLGVKPLFDLVGFKVRGDPLAGFRALRRKDWDRLELESHDFTIETEMNIKAVKLGFRIGETHIPHLKRGGGLLKSKFALNPKAWLKIMAVALRYVKDEKLKAKLMEFRSSAHKYLNIR